MLRVQIELKEINKQKLYGYNINNTNKDFASEILRLLVLVEHCNFVGYCFSNFFTSI